MIERNFDDYFKQIQDVASKKSSNSFSIENEFVPVMVNGSCEVVLRLLPQPKSEAAPFIENRSHSFQGTDGKWHVVDCLRKAGKKCPICEWNSAVYDAFPKDEAKKIAKKKAKRSFVSNVLVIKNPADPNTEGKVYRFKYGIQIMQKILEKMTDREDPDKGFIKGMNVFDYYKGANLIYKARQTNFGPNPDESYFGDQKPISDKNNVPLTDAEVQAIDDALYQLKPCEKDTSNETWESVISTYEKFREGEKLFDENKEAIIPGIAKGNRAATNESVRSELDEADVPETAAESSDDFFDTLK